MTDLIVSRPQPGFAGDLHQVSATLRGAGFDEEVWFRSTTPFDCRHPFAAESFLAVGLFAAMRERVPLRVEAPVSERLLHNLERYQHLVCRWYPEYRPTSILPEEILPEPTDDDGEAPAGMGFFFTGGVDSFHTYLTLQSELTHAIFLHGADIGLGDVHHRALVSGKLREATAEMGVELIEVESNLLAVTEAYCAWSKQFHGPGLVATAKLFSSRFRKVAIASSFPLTSLVAWGSHPITDPLWSGGGFEVIHQGADSTRIEKVTRIAGNPIARRYLRVCWERVEDAYNCCRCEKCVRTMVALRINGVLEDCPAFPLPLDVSLIPRIRYSTVGNRSEWNEKAIALRDRDDPELSEAIAELQSANEAAMVVREVARHTNAMLASPEWRHLAPKLRNKILRNLAGADPGWYAETVASSIGEVRDEAFAALWARDRKWLKRKLREAEARRFRRRVRSFFRRFLFWKRQPAGGRKPAPGPGRPVRPSIGRGFPPGG